MFGVFFIIFWVCAQLKYQGIKFPPTTLKRLLAPDYDDGVGKPRTVSVVDKLTPLPNPRKISTVVHSASEEDQLTMDSEYHSLALMQWGQFLAHDLSLTAMFRDGDGYLPDCKPCDADWHTCLPIPIPKDDPYFPVTHHSRCLEFVRYGHNLLTIHYTYVGCLN